MFCYCCFDRIRLCVIGVCVQHDYHIFLFVCLSRKILDNHRSSSFHRLFRKIDIQKTNEMLRIYPIDDCHHICHFFSSFLFFFQVNFDL